MRVIQSMEEACLLPAVECLMARETFPGGLAGISGQVSCGEYQSVR